MIEFRDLLFDDLFFLNETRNECAEEFLHDGRKFTIEQTISWWNEFVDEDKLTQYYIIENEGEKIGYFRTSNYSKKNSSLYIGADLNKNYRGMGLGYKSYLRFIPYIFERYSLNKISLEVLSTNTRAINLYKKIGFVQEGIKREEILKNGIYVDSIIMSILRKEYEEMFNH